MAIKNILLLATAAFLFACTNGSSKKSEAFEKAPEKTAAELNKIKTVELETRASNMSDESNYHRATLYLTDYDRKMDQAVAVIDGLFEKGNADDYTPYINEVCFAGDQCGVMVTAAASLEDMSLDIATVEINRAGLKDARDIDKSLFKNGSMLLIHSETRENEKSPVWSITVAVEIVDFKPNAKRVKIRYKVLEYKLKEISV